MNFLACQSPRETGWCAGDDSSAFKVHLPSLRVKKMLCASSITMGLRMGSAYSHFAACEYLILLRIESRKVPRTVCLSAKCLSCMNKDLSLSLIPRVGHGGECL